MEPLIWMLGSRRRLQSRGTVWRDRKDRLEKCIAQKRDAWVRSELLFIYCPGETCSPPSPEVYTPVRRAFAGWGAVILRSPPRPPALVMCGRNFDTCAPHLHHFHRHLCHQFWRLHPATGVGEVRWYGTRKKPRPLSTMSILAPSWYD